SGLTLKPYPVLRQTLSELKPTVEFYLTVAALPGEGSLDSSALYMTGDEKSTTQYVTRGGIDEPTLLMTSFSVDPYAILLSPYQQEFLARMGGSQGSKSGSSAEWKGAETKEPFPSLQQFARGQTAQLAYCGSRNYDLAADAYRKAMAHGFADTMWVAEAHHRLGVALEGKGRLQEAKTEMEESLRVRPNTPEVLNNLGTVFTKLGDPDNAMKMFEKAVTLRPNYPIARYNLAEAYEPVNGKRALSEYETYLALVEGIPEEEARAAQARKRINALRR
ncbi:MAG: tetratricopeptide repeat protein, partial [Nitrospiraceae bacterium]